MLNFGVIPRHFYSTLMGCNMQGLSLQCPFSEVDEVPQDGLQIVHPCAPRSDDPHWKGCDLGKSVFRGIDGQGLTVSRCNLDRAIIQNTDLAGSRWTRCSFDGATLLHVSFGPFKPLHWACSEIPKQQATESIAYCSELRDCSLKGGFVSDVDMTECLFEEVDLSDTTFVRVKFNKAQLRNVTVKDATFVDCEFDGWALDDVVFRNCKSKMIGSNWFQRMKEEEEQEKRLKF